MSSDGAGILQPARGDLPADGPSRRERPAWVDGGIAPERAELAAKNHRDYVLVLSIKLTNAFTLTDKFHSLSPSLPLSLDAGDGCSSRVLRWWK